MPSTSNGGACGKNCPKSRPVVNLHKSEGQVVQKSLMGHRTAHLKGVEKWAVNRRVQEQSFTMGFNTAI